MRTILTEDFFRRPAPVVAADLLGKFLVRKDNGKEIAVMITETEAYEGLDDLASHASKGRTKRTEVMFNEAGRFYVYLIYGMYFMLNVVTGETGQPSAVLIRASDRVTGPGRLTRLLNITKSMNTKLAAEKTGLWFEDRGIAVTKRQIKRGPRIGVAYAGPIWSKKPWNYIYVIKEAKLTP